MSYWTVPTSFVRDSKGKAIHHLSAPVAPVVEKSPSLPKKSRPQGDDSRYDPPKRTSPHRGRANDGDSPAGSDEVNRKKAKKTSSPRKHKEEGKEKGKSGKDKTKSKKKKDNEGKSEKKLITLQRNVFVERNRSTLPADEVPVCECRPEREASDGACGARCINRVTFTECIANYCPLGARCTNQRFQRREYAPLKRFEAGPKGYGVRCERDLKKGEFIMEYCGEVISQRTCMERLKRSRELGEHNFYILTLSANECVDAARKGNLARFINHSCEPNCETQKWMVAGELCVGLFAHCDIPAGTELTFDYQFERVGGDKQKCYCGTPSCRGYLGAKKPLGEAAKQERDAKDKLMELKGRIRIMTFDQLLPIVSNPDPPERPPKGLFLHRNAMSGYRRWARELREKMPQKEKKSKAEERDVPLERHLKQMLAELAADGFDLSELK